MHTHTEWILLVMQTACYHTSTITAAVLLQQLGRRKPLTVSREEEPLRSHFWTNLFPAVQYHTLPSMVPYYLFFVGQTLSMVPT